MKQYIITGASGHIGNNLVKYINSYEPDASIKILTRRKITKELKNTTFEQIIGDFSNNQFLENNITPDSIVIHLAGLIDLSDKKIDELYQTNYIITKNICDICIAKSVKKFIYVGSVDGIYKPERNAVISEPNNYYPDKIIGNYGKTKALASKYVLDAINANPEFNAAIVLPSAVIGANDMKPSAVGNIILNVLKGKPEFGMKGGYNFVDVKDVCYVIYTLCNGNFRDQYIVSGHNITVKELYTAINKLKNLKLKPIIIPTFLVYILSPFIKVLSPITIKALLEPHNYSSQKAKTELGLITTPFEQTLADTVNDIENNFIFKQ